MSGLSLDPTSYCGIAFACNGALRASLDSQPTWLNNVQTLVLQAPFIGSTKNQTLPHYLLWGIRSCLTSLRKVVWAVRSGTFRGYIQELWCYFLLRWMIRQRPRWKNVKCQLLDANLPRHSASWRKEAREWSEYIVEAKQLDLHTSGVSEVSEIEGAEQSFRNSFGDVLRECGNKDGRRSLFY